MMKYVLYFVVGLVLGGAAIFAWNYTTHPQTPTTTVHVAEHTGKVVLDLQLPAEVIEPFEGVTITVDGNPVQVDGSRIKVGDTLNDVVLDKPAEEFNKVTTGSIGSMSGYKLIHVVPSLDTPVCTRQTKELESAAALFPEVTFAIVSNDTPFALNRFCSANSIDNLAVFSDARTRQFGETNGLFMPNYGLLTRAIMVVDPQMKVLYIDYAEEVTSELDLLNALAFLKQQIEQQ